MATDSIKVNILEDGTVEVETSKVSQSNHQNADEFLEFLARELGGAVTKTRIGHGHAHSHGHVHEHDKAEG